MSAGSCLLRLLLALGALSLVACGDTTRSSGPGAGGTAGQGGSAASPVSADLSIVGVVDRSDGDCTVQPNDAGELRALGTLDRALASSYSALLLVQSTHSERVVLQAVEVSLENAVVAPSDGGSSGLGLLGALAGYRSTLSGFLDGATADGSPSFGVAVADLLPPALAEGLEPGLLRLHVELHAKPISGAADELVSAELVFPLELCEGCLVSYPEAARDPASPDGSYLCVTGAAAGMSSEAPQPCQLGLDTPASCATCSDALELCRDPALNPSH